MSDATPKNQHFEQIISHDYHGWRADQVAAELFSDFSRSRLQYWMKQGNLTVNQQTVSPKEKVLGGETMTLTVVLEDEGQWLAQDMSLSIVYEDDDLLVVNKPTDLVVHPAAGNPDKTMLNGLLHHNPECRHLPRCGIVHRLDKDTTGLLVVAKTLAAHTFLVKSLQEREFSREYEAVVMGTLTGGGTVDAPIGRHPKNRKKMAVTHGGKEAITHYRLMQRFIAHTHLSVKLETGRTHQIRVHMAHIKHPIVGDTLYCGRAKLPKNCGTELRDVLQQFPRQALHARHLGLVHPTTLEWMEWEAPLPEDFTSLLASLKQEDEDNER